MFEKTIMSILKESVRSRRKSVQHVITKKTLFYENRNLKKENEKLSSQNEKLSSQVEELEDKINQLESQKNPFDYSFFDILVYLSHRFYQMYTVKLSQLGLTDWNKLFIFKLYDFGPKIDNFGPFKGGK